MRSQRCRSSIAAGLVCALVGSAMSSNACAQTNRARKVAQQKVNEGSVLLKKGEFRDALARFEEAFQHVASAKIQYNIGLSYLGLGRDAEALEAFRAFLVGAPDAPKDTIDNARQHRDRLLAVVATLDVSFPLEGAEVFVDGISFGKTPLKRPIYLNAGPHQVLVQKEGAAQVVKRISLAQGEKASLVMVPADQKARAEEDVSPSALPGSEGPKPLDAVVKVPMPDRGTEVAGRGARGWMRPAAWTAGAGAVVFLGAGVAAQRP